jgi:hypothetical protein
MDGNAVKDIERIVRDATIVDVEGVKFSAHKLTPVLDCSAISNITLSTLTGLKDYIAGNLDGLEKEQMFIVVEGYDLVKLLLCADKKTKIRQNPITIVLDKNGKNFPFGNFLSIEDFIIRLSSTFSKTEDLAIIQQYVSKLTVNNSIQTEDDGISQKATTKKGVSGALVESTKAPSTAKLKPNRTFNEVDQPISEFIFRLKTGSNSEPLCALFEADGGAWKAASAQSIKQWIANNIQNINIIA